MKYSLLTFLIICSEVLFGQSQRMVFVEEFTQSSCPPCAVYNPSFNSTLNQNTGKVISLKYQAPWPGYDVMNTQNPLQVQSKISFYSVPYVPYPILNGTTPLWPYPLYQSSIDDIYATPSPFSIQLNYWFNTAADSIYVFCEATASLNTTLTTGKLRIALVERAISFTAAPGTNGETVFENVMRKMYPDADGTKLSSSWTLGEKKAVSFNKKIPDYIYDKNQLAVVAWIQDDSGFEIKQAAISTVVSPLNLPPVAAFSSIKILDCSESISFNDESVFPSSWLWDFGDGTTSKLQNPTHIYTSEGNFTVKLTVSNANGSNEITKSSYADINYSGTTPVGSNKNICKSGIINLTATTVAGGTLSWYDSTGIIVNTGVHYTPTVSGTTKYYVKETSTYSIDSIGPKDNTIGSGDFYNRKNTDAIVFNVSKSCTLISVETYAAISGNRTIVLVDVGGSLIDSVVVDIPSGKSTVMLNLPLKPGIGYLLGVSSDNVNLYRNTTGGTLPYKNSVITITGNVYGDPGYYYFFYNWKVKQNSCESQPVIVSAIDSCASNGTIIGILTTVSPICCSTTGIAANDVLEAFNAIPNPNNGTFILSFHAHITDDYKVSIINLLGKEIYIETLNDFSGTYGKHIDISQASKGVYIVRISNSKSQAVKRILTY